MSAIASFSVPTGETIRSYREAEGELLPQFIEAGYWERHLFPHRVVLMQKCGPDALKLARNMCGVRNVEDIWLAVLQAGSEVVRDLPPELFFDDDVVWHRQHFGQPGHVAFATFAVQGDTLYGLNYVSDIVQRQARAGRHRTRINNLFRGWPYLLLNAITSFAAEQGLTAVHSPTAEFAIAHADPARPIEPAMFQRIYDLSVTRRYEAERSGDWWTIDIARNRPRIVCLPRKTERWSEQKTICVCHDIEGGLGHLTIDPVFAERADATWRTSLRTMVAWEGKHDVAATYCVVGKIFQQAKALIDNSAAAMAFHSSDHVDRVGYRLPSLFNRLSALKSLRKISANFRERRAGHYSAELDRCRRIDYRARGYRPPRSRLAGDLTLGRFAYYNFDWLSSSRGSLGVDRPTIDGPIVKIPTLFDDFGLYKTATPYGEWERAALQAVEHAPFIAFSLHDCYADYWLPHYDRFLTRLKDLGTLKTLDQVADELFLTRAD